MSRTPAAHSRADAPDGKAIRGIRRALRWLAVGLFLTTVTDPLMGLIVQAKDFIPVPLLLWAWRGKRLVTDPCTLVGF
jgi:hypothetical protein